MKTILIIDDDVAIGNMEEEVLRRAGYDTKRAYSGTEASLLLGTLRPDLILLDLMLPGISGEELLPLIKSIPTIVVSAKAAGEDKANLLLGGAADYITKPFDTRELLARIAVRLRENVKGWDEGIISCGDISIDTLSHEVRVCGAPVKLTRTEYALLKLLIKNRGRVATKSFLLENIAYDTPDCTESSLKTHISHMRGKLREAGKTDKEYIESVWGIGFRFTD